MTKKHSTQRSWWHRSVQSLGHPVHRLIAVPTAIIGCILIVAGMLDESLVEVLTSLVIVGLSVVLFVASVMAERATRPSDG